MTTLRHTSFREDPKTLARQASENARDTQQALSERATCRVAVVERYTAQGSTTVQIQIAAKSLPAAVMLASASSVGDASASLAATGNANFEWDSLSGSAQVYEPSGLTANTVYRLVFLVIGEV